MPTHTPLRIIVVGLGHQSLDDHLPALVECQEFQLVAVCDIDPEKVEFASKYYKVPGTTDLRALISDSSGSIDVALVAVPHQAYLPIVQALADAKIHIIKEKPFATSYADALGIARAVTRNGVKLILTLQRRYNPVFSAFSQLVRRIGRVHSIEARYVMNVSNLGEGWRASRLFAGGGALIDLGYHYVDLLVWYFGLPTSVSCQVSGNNRDGQEYDVEDTAFVQFGFHGEGTAHPILGSLVVSRVYPTKEEGMVAFGTRGHVAVQRGSVCRYFGDNQQERLERIGAWPSALIDQLEHCASIIRDGYVTAIHDDYLRHVSFIEACYESARTMKPIDPHIYFRQLHDAIARG